MRRIECRKCDSAYCDGCNIYILATMLNQGKLDCLMDEHHTITIDPEELRPKGEWKLEYDGKYRVCKRCNICIPRTAHVPDNKGADMRCARMEETEC